MSAFHRLLLASSATTNTEEEALRGGGGGNRAGMPELRLHPGHCLQAGPPTPTAPPSLPDWEVALAGGQLSPHTPCPQLGLQYLVTSRVSVPVGVRPAS